MGWWLLLVTMWMALGLTGCGAGQSGGMDTTVVTAPSTSSTAQPTPPATSSVIVTVTTDYVFAHQAIRFVQVAGDADFDPPIIVVDQGLRFQFRLPKGYRYRLSFTDTPSIDEPSAYEVNLVDANVDTLELPFFHFAIHP